MSGGADLAGDDMVVGRTNESEERTILVAKPTLEYQADFVLSVGIEGGWSSTKSHQGIDAIQATGAIVEPPSGGGGGPAPEPAANGVVRRGLNGVVGYPHAVPRDRGGEREAQAGVFGAGGTNAAGVFGRGQNGIVGCEQTTPRDATFEAGETAGVLGRGPIGVSGDGLNGPGVHGRGGPGVLGDGVTGLPGVLGDGGAAGGIGVLGQGHDAQGIHGKSEGERGGIFESTLNRAGTQVRAQISLVPLTAKNPADPSGGTISDPSQLTRADAGDLCVTITKDVRTNMRPIAALWFCTETNGPVGTPVWVKIA